MTTDPKFPKIEGTGEEAKSELLRVRLRKEDSAYVYAVFEANEGIAAYSTLPHREGDFHRDLEFIVPLSQMPEMMRLLELLKEELHGELILLSRESPSPPSHG